MSYLTLIEAAEYVSDRTGLQIEPAALLRSGVRGVMMIAAPFSSLMRNLNAHTNEHYLGLLVIPPMHLLEIETDGQTRIVGAFSLDGKTAYSPQVVRAREQLRVLVSELDKVMPYFVKLDTASPAPVATGGVKWTPERMAELKAFRKSHTMPETVKKFRISEQRIRQLLPSAKPKAKPFAGLIHRST